MSPPFCSLLVWLSWRFVNFIDIFVEAAFGLINFLYYSYFQFHYFWPSLLSPSLFLIILYFHRYLYYFLPSCCFVFIFCSFSPQFLDCWFDTFLLFTYMPLMIHICIEFSSVSPKHCFSYIPQILRYYFHFPAFQNFLIFTETASLTHGYLQFEALFVFGFGRATWLVIEPGPSAVREQSPNHWITRKFPIYKLKLKVFLSIWGVFQITFCY